MTGNRLARASSPYLKLHADNPVNWQPWDEEAFRQAREEDKMVFLSVGYSSCHWCHVMERESFADAEVARILNEHFVSIKVDREERPDLDEVYMTAVQMATGRGGWPMTLFLTPDKKPFFAGTYFPREDRGRYPGFKSLISEFAAKWKLERNIFQDVAERFASALRAHRTATGRQSQGWLDRSVVISCVEALRSRYDRRYGGFGDRPKFPPHSALSLLLYLAEHENQQECLEMALGTLDGMMLGGIHDHVGGGFHRYSTDDRWFLPHFEKMLYDNALLLRAYSKAYRLTRNEEYRRVCERIVSWLVRDMTSPEGVFYSAMDADTEGEEGLHYTWKFSEIREVLGARSEAFARAYGLEEDGNYLDEATRRRTGRNVLFLKSRPSTEFDADLAILLDRRNQRPRPGLDDKALVAWNGLVISALACWGEVALAKRAAEAILAAHPIPHQFVAGKPEGRAFLDVVYLVEGLLDLEVATGDLTWRRKAEDLFLRMAAEFRDPKGGWFFSGEEHEELFGRAKPVLDSALPSPNGVVVQCAVRLGQNEVAREDLQAVGGWMQEAPYATESLILGLAMLLPQVSSGALVYTKPEVKITVEPVECEVQDDVAEFEVFLHIPEGCHLGGFVLTEGLAIPTRVEVKGFESASLDFDKNISSLSGKAVIRLRGIVPKDMEGEAKAEVTFQLCTESECYLPETKSVNLAWHRQKAPLR